MFPCSTFVIKEVFPFPFSSPYFEKENFGPLSAMSNYTRQLNSECNNVSCAKIFCRRHYNTEVTARLSDILSNYSDIFNCSNIEKLISGSVAEYNYYIIDLYFYTTDLMYNSSTEDRTATKDFFLKKIKVQKTLTHKNTTKSPKNIIKVKPYQELDHSFCVIFEKVLDQTDIYLLIGIIHLLLSKFQKYNNFNIGLVIIRLFTTISKSSSLDRIYYKALHNVYGFVYKKLMDSIIDVQLAETQTCVCSRCLFQLDFSKLDFLSSLKSVANALNTSIITNVRESAKTKNLLEIFTILYNINNRIFLVSYENFYLKIFCSKLNLRIEFRFYKLKYDTALNYSFMLSLHIKAELLKMGNGELMKVSLQDAFFRSLFEGVTDPYLFLTIRREYVYKDTVEIVRNLSEEDMKKQLKVKFVDEDGVDSGGIKKEYFQLLSREIANDRKLFTIKNNRVWLKRGVDLVSLNAIGRIFGIALYNDVVLNVPLPFIIFKKMLQIQLDFSDLEEIEPDHYRSMMNLDRCTAEEIAELELFFIVDVMEDGKHSIEELVLNGQNIRVTKDNFLAFKHAYSQFHMDKLIGDEFDAFLDGFTTMVDKKSVSILRPCELEKIIIGVDDFDFDLIEAYTTYNGYTRESRIILDFWMIFRSYSLSYKKRLLQFITGNDRLPAAGSSSLKLIIMRNGCDTERLPSSQTCFNTLLLPEYSSKVKLAKKLDKAIKLTAGFYLI